MHNRSLLHYTVQNTSTVSARTQSSTNSACILKTGSTTSLNNFLEAYSFIRSTFERAEAFQTLASQTLAPLASQTALQPSPYWGLSPLCWALARVVTHSTGECGTENVDRRADACPSAARVRFQNAYRCKSGDPSLSDVRARGRRTWCSQTTDVRAPTRAIRVSRPTGAALRVLFHILEWCAVLMLHIRFIYY